MHNGLVTYWTLWYIGHATQRAGCTTGLWQVAPYGILGMLHRGQGAQRACDISDPMGYWVCCTKGRVHNGLVTYRTLWYIGYVAQMAGCTTGLWHVGPYGILGMLHKGQGAQRAFDMSDPLAYWVCYKKGSVHNGLVTSRTLWHIGYVTQRAVCTTGLWHIRPYGILNMFYSTVNSSYNQVEEDGNMHIFLYFLLCQYLDFTYLLRRSRWIRQNMFKNVCFKKNLQGQKRVDQITSSVWFTIMIHNNTCVGACLGCSDRLSTGESASIAFDDEQDDLFYSASPHWKRH